MALSNLLNNWGQTDELFLATLFFGDWSLICMVKTEFGVQGTCVFGSPFICQWNTVGSDPADNILWRKKLTFTSKWKCVKKNFFKHVSSILSTEPSFNRAIRNFIWLKTFQVTPHFGHNQCKILSHVILFSNLVAFHKDVFKCPHKSNSSFMLHCL